MSRTLRPQPTLAPPQPTRVRADGYTAIVSLSPPPARHADLDAVRGAAAANERAAFDELARQRAEIARLEREKAALSKRIDAIEKRAGQAVARAVEDLRALQAELRQRPSAADVASLQQSSRLQQLQSVVSAVQAAAYGEQGAVLSRNNLMLIANQVAWMYAGPALRRLGLVTAPQAELVAMLAPLGTLVTGGLTLGRAQHVQFLTGLATFDGTNRVVVQSLRPRIADAHWRAFAGRIDVPLSVTSVGARPFPGAAAVRNGAIVLTLPSSEAGKFTGQVAWIVDTGASGG